MKGFFVLLQTIATFIISREILILQVKAGPIVVGASSGCFLHCKKEAR